MLTETTNNTTQLKVSTGILHSCVKGVKFMIDNLERTRPRILASLVFKIGYFCLCYNIPIAMFALGFIQICRASFNLMGLYCAKDADNLSDDNSQKIKFYQTTDTIRIGSIFIALLMYKDGLCVLPVGLQMMSIIIDVVSLFAPQPTFQELATKRDETNPSIQ